MPPWGMGHGNGGRNEGNGLPTANAERLAGDRSPADGCARREAVQGPGEAVTPFPDGAEPLRALCRLAGPFAFVLEGRRDEAYPPPLGTCPVPVVSVGGPSPLRIPPPPQSPCPLRT